MARQLIEPTYDEWLRWVFDHPVTDPEWHFEDEADWWDETAEPARATDYLTRLFEDPVPAVRPYSDAQINQGLWFLASPSCSNHMFALFDSSVEWGLRERCIRSIYVLYRDLFAPRCSDDMVRPPDGSRSSNPLDAISYMWWELSPWPHNARTPERERIDAAILEVLAQTLRLPSNACRKGALFGLGQLAYHYTDRVAAIVDDFLGSASLVPMRLRMRALRVRSGHVV